MLAYSLVGDTLQQGAGPAVRPGMARHVVSSPDLTGQNHCYSGSLEGKATEMGKTVETPDKGDQ